MRKGNLARLEEPSNVKTLPLCPQCHLPITEHNYPNLSKCHCRENLPEDEIRTKTLPAPQIPTTNGKTLLITGCCKEKLDHPAPAKDLYQGRLFKLVKTYTETNQFDWVIISAEYGLVTPEQVLEPYDTQIKTIGDVKRVHQLVMPVLESTWGDYAKIIVILGKRYRQVIEPELTQLPPQKVVIIEDKRGIGGLCQQVKALLPPVTPSKKSKHTITGAEQAMPELEKRRCDLCVACGDYESARCSGKHCSKPACNMTRNCFDDGDCEDGCDFESLGEVVPPSAHYRCRKTGELGCLACEDSEGDGPSELYCNLFHVQVENRHRCKLLKESRHHQDLRLGQEAEAQAAAQAEQAKPKPMTLDKFLRRGA